MAVQAKCKAYVRGYRRTSETYVRGTDVRFIPNVRFRRTYVYKWKNHFYEMKGDVGMSLHEKERNKKMPT